MSRRAKKLLRSTPRGTRDWWLVATTLTLGLPLNTVRALTVASAISRLEHAETVLGRQLAPFLARERGHEPDALMFPSRKRSARQETWGQPQPIGRIAAWRVLSGAWEHAFGVEGGARELRALHRELERHA